MRLGLPVDVLHDEPAALARAGRLRDRGLLDWAELRLPRAAEPPDPRTVERTAALVGEVGVAVSLHSEATTFVAHAHGRVRDQVCKALSATIDLARRIGAGLITIHPPLSGALRVDRMTGAGWSDRDKAVLAGVTCDQKEAEKWFVELLVTAAGELAPFGGAVAIENMRPRKHAARLNQVRELARLVDALGRPEVRLCLDSRKAQMEGMEPSGFIRTRSDLIANVHVGEVSEAWAALAGALRDVDYDGPVIYEGPADLAEASLAAMRRAMADANAGHAGGAG